MTRPGRSRLMSLLIRLVGARRDAPTRRRVREECDTLARWARRADRTDGDPSDGRRS
ncbi:MAG: hypothetical protein WD336_04135 [Trueperaceae bacterium]